MHDAIYPTVDELFADATDPKEPTGFLEPPTHYIGADGRETIDVMRDTCRAAARALLRDPSRTIDVYDLGDAIFALFCQVTALGYERRAGRKGDPAGDFAKERFYLEMSTHVLHGLVDDPRSGRTTGPTSYTPGPIDTEPDVGGLRHSLEIR